MKNSRFQPLANASNAVTANMQATAGSAPDGGSVVGTSANTATARVCVQNAWGCIYPKRTTKGNGMIVDNLDPLNEDRLVTVCDKCLTANCWHGRHMCQYSDSAGTVDLPVSTLARLAREHPEAWEPGFPRRGTG